jgi:hypothetical protein
MIGENDLLSNGILARIAAPQQTSQDALIDCGRYDGSVSPDRCGDSGETGHVKN